MGETAALTNYYHIVMATSILLICGYIVVLARTWRGSKYMFVIAISLMLLGSNLFAILSDSAMKPWILDPSGGKKIPYLLLQCLSTFVRDSLFNLAHWVFSYKYWLIGVEMEQLLLNHHKYTQKSQTINRLFIALDFAVPLVYTSLYYAVNIQYDGNPDDFTYQLNVLLVCFFVCSALRGCLLLISALLLGDALFRMRRAIEKVAVV